MKFSYFTLSFHFFLQIPLIHSLQVDDKGKHLSAHTKEAIWQHIQPFINQQHVHNQGTVLHGETRLRLIIKRPLILKHRKTNHQKLPISRHPSRFLTPPTSKATIRTTNPSIILTNMSRCALHHNPTQPSTTFLSYVSMTNHSSRLISRRHQTSVAAKLFSKLKTTNIANLTCH